MPRRRKSGSKKSAYFGPLRRAIKAFLLYPAKSKCQICGYHKYAGSLTFHHKNPRHKLFNISAMLLTHPLSKLVREAAKCIVVCNNCHGEVHAGMVLKSKLAKISTLDFSGHKIPVDILKWHASNLK